MEFLTSEAVRGHLVELQRSDPRHLAGSAGAAAPRGADTERAFGAVFFEALRQVNDLQVRAMERQQQMVTAPDSVDIHDVTIAIAEANLAIATAKQISDAALRAYREIISVR